MRIAPLSAMAVGALAASAVAAAADTREFNLPSFKTITVSSGLDVDITVGGTQSVRAEADDRRLLDKLELTVRNGELEIEIDRSFLDFIFDGGLSDWLAGRPRISVTVVTPTLHGLEANAGATVQASGMTGGNLSVEVSSGARLEVSDMAANFLAVDGSSGGALEISGTCSQLEADVSSGARLSLDDLVCSDVAVEASSGASASVNATQSVEAEASSGGRVEVSGQPPKIEVDTSSGGDVDFESG